MKKNKKIIVLSLLLFVVVLVVLFVKGSLLVDNNQGYEPQQPIPFSHKVHAGENKINCLYCHYGAERSRHAGIPAASVCMNCHSQIKSDVPDIQKVKEAIDKNEVLEWVRVHRMSDFVYFSHEQHVGVGKINCQTCHGQVEKMTRIRQDKNMTMGWCIECHRASDVVVHKGEKLDTRKVSDMGGLDCSKCHY